MGLSQSAARIPLQHISRPFMGIIIALVVGLAIAGCGRHGSITTGTGTGGGSQPTVPTVSGTTATATPPVDLQTLQHTLGTAITTMQGDEANATSTGSEGGQP